MRQLTQNGFSHSISMNKDCTLFISICSNLSTQYKTYIYEIKKAANVDKIDIKQLAQIISLCLESIQLILLLLFSNPDPDFCIYIFSNL